jgi:cytidylate kinase
MTENPPVIIAIDGTAASGKGTLARRLAQQLGYAYLDTGLLYRRVALTLIEQGLSTDNTEAAINAAKTLDPTTLDNPTLRGAEAGRGASVVAAIPEVRQALTDFQRQFPLKSGKSGAVIDGRDIGTVIFPDAAAKFFIDAGIKARAERRHRELIAAGENISYSTVLADMQTRDARDAGRSFRPMKAADDAILLDTTAMDAEAVFAAAIKHLQQSL